MDQKKNLEIDIAVALAQGWVYDPARPPGDIQMKKPWNECSPWERVPDKFWLSGGYVYILVGPNKKYSYSPTTDWSISGHILDDWFPQILKHLDEKLKNFTFNETHLKRPYAFYEKLGYLCGCRGEFLPKLMEAYVAIAPPPH